MPEINAVTVYSNRISLNSGLHPTQPLAIIPLEENNCHCDLQLTIPHEVILRYEIHEVKGKDALFVVFRKSSSDPEENLQIGTDKKGSLIIETAVQALNMELKKNT